MHNSGTTCLRVYVPSQKMILSAWPIIPIILSVRSCYTLYISVAYPGNLQHGTYKFIYGVCVCVCVCVGGGRRVRVRERGGEHNAGGACMCVWTNALVIY